MAQSKEQATEAFLLTGFSTILDWRPTQFSRPPPRPLICDLCGVVSLRPVFPGSCPHWYCTMCYRNVLRHDPPLCPLDQKEVSESDLAGDAFSVDLVKLLKEAGMRCPNCASGCDFVLTDLLQIEKSVDCIFLFNHCPGLYSSCGCRYKPPLTDLELHYSKCQFHRIFCEACDAPVASGKIVEHIKNGCKLSASGNGSEQAEYKAGSS
ncbi:TNF receptor-associated factor 6-like [Ixodes scapularis]